MFDNQPNGENRLNTDCRIYKEIAKIAGTTEGAARVHYHNAMRAVKEFLNG